MNEMNKLSFEILDCAYKVHSELGPGLLESTYETCLSFELLKKDIKFQRQLEMPVVYKGNLLDAGYRLDLLIEDMIVIEIKSVEQLAPIHQAQLLTYLKLSGKKLGLLVNFNEVHLKDGIRRFIL